MSTQWPVVQAECLPMPITVSQRRFLLVMGTFDLSWRAYSAPAKQPPAPITLQEVQSGTPSLPISPASWLTEELPLHGCKNKEEHLPAMQDHSPPH